MAPGSRRSVRSSTPIPMPVIAEDASSDPRHGATTPTAPPRSPHRRPASSTRSNSYMGSGSYSGSSAGSGSISRPSLSRSSSVPQYVPKTRRVPGIRAVGGDVGSVRSIPLNSNGSERWVIPQVLTDTAADGTVTKGKGKGKGKGAALSEATRNTDTKSSTRKHSYDDPDPPLPTDLFPAGSYTFTAALTNLSASCAPQGNPSLWRCYPYTLYSPSMAANESSSLSAAASFRWIIRPVTSYSYVISSSDDPFSPTGTFRDVNLTMIDANQPSERFTFSFTMAKAVVPDVSGASGGSSGASSTASSSTTTPTTTTTTTTIAIAVSSSSSSLSPTASSSASAHIGDQKRNSGTPPSKRRRWFKKRTVRRDAAEILQETATPTPAPAICWYNQTIVRGTIWTRMRASYPASITNVSTPIINATNEFAPWPFAVQLTLEQTYEEDERGNGKKAPDCRDAQGNSVVFDGYNNNDNVARAMAVPVEERDLNGMNVVDEADICRCSYANYGLDTNGTTGTGNPQGGQSQGLG
ncbi:hypothetical protein B0T20DRAFT_354479 [Sordaria brevicollis]|uniref:Uncharacterized protein n=1 Tax=Sordaria brevicollis TaxID=83679 RepID=A0AAE0UC58_SORBR|nr:hypothetical protein B0T20DRAFT_354479 [Sordaria brevicollis]